MEGFRAASRKIVLEQVAMGSTWLESFLVLREGLLCLKAGQETSEQRPHP